MWVHMCIHVSICLYVNTFVYACVRVLCMCVSKGVHLSVCDKAKLKFFVLRFGRYLLSD